MNEKHEPFTILCKKLGQNVGNGDRQVGKIGEGEVVEGEGVVRFELGHLAKVVG